MAKEKEMSEEKEMEEEEKEEEMGEEEEEVLSIPRGGRGAMEEEDRVVEALADESEELDTRQVPHPPPPLSFLPRPKSFVVFGAVLRNRNRRNRNFLPYGTGTVIR